VWVGQGDFDKQRQRGSPPELLEQNLATELTGSEGYFEPRHPFDLVEFADGLHHLSIIASQ
jgi:hypothetical protein